MAHSTTANQPVTGFVLAGGKSTRMGQDKAALQLDGRTLLEHALEVLRRVAGEVCILGPRQRYAGYGVPVVEDVFPGCGPLAGIHAALSHTTTRLNLIIAVDTPFLSAKFLRFMIERAVSSGATVTTPEIAGYRQPLCSIYAREFLAIAEQALRRPGMPGTAPQAEALPVPEQGKARPNSAGKNKNTEYKIVPLFPPDRTCVITEAEMRRFAFTPEMFENLNTPEDVERARRREAKL
jgi:molybdenum cofactor guanylyltransferase